MVIASFLRHEPKRSERWLLVTSALHMPRAVGVFGLPDFRLSPIRWNLECHCIHSPHSLLAPKP